MPNGGSDCCGACWFNRSNSGKRGSRNFNRDIPGFCEIRHLAIPNRFYTYCANHPYRRSSRDPIPIGPVYVHGDNDVREFWQPSPDTEEIRQHLLDIVRAPEEHIDGTPSTHRLHTRGRSSSWWTSATSGSSRRWRTSPSGTK